jgi:2-oxoglutarate ferredoxin oxidoreductase subunit gamma
MLVKTIFAGFGGQGVLMMGFSLSHCAMSEGYEVTFLPAYGAEMRGGTANCTVAIGDEEIASPISSEPNYIVVMNTPSLYSFQNKVVSGGVLFINSSIIKSEPRRKDISFYKIPSSEIAEQIGNSRASNTVMMGAFIQKTGIVSPEAYLKSLESVMGSKKKNVMDINRKAFASGYEYMSRLL